MTKIQIKKLEWLFRITIALTFLGHGMFAILGLQSWHRYLEVVGFSLSQATPMVVGIGYLDVIVAIIVLLRPNKYILLWAIIWAFATALVRPFAGESIWAFVERGANWAVPLAFLMILNHKTTKK